MQTCGIGGHNNDKGGGPLTLNTGFKDILNTWHLFN